MNFKSITDISKIPSIIGNLDFDSYHKSTKDKNGDLMIKFHNSSFSRGKQCIQIKTIKGSKDFSALQFNELFELVRNSVKKNWDKKK